jgi:hypothetical protein
MAEQTDKTDNKNDKTKTFGYFKHLIINLSILMIFLFITEFIIDASVLHHTCSLILAFFFAFVPLLLLFLHRLIPASEMISLGSIGMTFLMALILFIFRSKVYKFNSLDLNKLDSTKIESKLTSNSIFIVFGEIKPDLKTKLGDKIATAEDFKPLKIENSILAADFVKISRFSHLKKQRIYNFVKIDLTKGTPKELEKLKEDLDIDDAGVELAGEKPTEPAAGEGAPTTGEGAGTGAGAPAAGEGAPTTGEGAPTTGEGAGTGEA